MDSDFSGYATKAGLKCSDGRTIMPQAFAHQDQAQVPLVWQHGHTDPENVLGHAILEKREDGVYAYGFFNDSAKATHARGLLEHKDINQLSIWANDLIERGGRVLHGAIREVSLVLSGANPGALIENVTIRHSDGIEDTIEGEAIITTGEELELGHELAHSEDSEEPSEEDSEELAHADEEEGDLDEDTIADVYESLTDKQKDVVHYMIGEALESNDGEVKQSDISDETDDSVEDDEAEGSDELKQDNMDSNTDTAKEGTAMSNVFEQGDEKSPETYELTHSDIEGIVADATRKGSLKGAVEDFAIAHGIDNIETLFPDAKATSAVPELDKRRTEWVQAVIGGATKTPFARVKTLSADLTLDDARAKGYITGKVKREEFFSVQKRSTTPTTIYKKQKLDRDDIIDITDFDVVAFLKGEMRLMLEEELARAILIGDGRSGASDDKISETNIRPIATDHQLYTTRIGVDLTDTTHTGATADSDKAQALIDAVIKNRRYYKGSGMPTFFTSETVISLFLLLKDADGRKIYSGLSDVAADLRVKAIVPVELFDDGDIDTEDEVVGIMVNLSDYTIGADAGGQVSMFDDFDIDYNQYKYLIETRVSGALTKLKSALVFYAVNAAADIIAASSITAPTFDSANGDLTITAVTNIAFYDATNDPDFTTELTGVNAGYVDTPGRSVKIVAVPDAGYEIDDPSAAEFRFTRDYA